MTMPPPPHLFYPGDNRHGLRRLAALGIAVDLVYIDPPFATNQDFLIDPARGRANAVSASGRPAYSDRLLGAAYLDALGERLDAIRAVMSPSGSIYVHIDVKMEHYVRLLLDDIFGSDNFRNSITRIKCNPKNFARHSYGNIKDTILFYSVSPRRITWHPQPEPLSAAETARLYPRADAAGRRYATTPLHAPGATRDGATGQPWRGMPPPPGRHWRYPPSRLDELDAAGRIEWSRNGNPRQIRYAGDPATGPPPGKLPQDVWLYKDPQRPQYPTQKNARMLERIISASSNPGDTVLDCYAGSGATLLTAARLRRRFIGMDDAPAAQQVIAERLQARRIEWQSLPDYAPTGRRNGYCQLNAG